MKPPPPLRGGLQRQQFSAGDWHLREKHGPTQSIVIVADHDSSGVGQRYAEQASAKYGARMVMPPILGDANDYAQAGHNLVGLLMPIKDDWLIPADDFCAQPSPILAGQALDSIQCPNYGSRPIRRRQDLCCARLVPAHGSATEEWAGHKVRQGNVVYLAGEGHHGLRGRVAAWKHHHAPTGKMAMWLSKDGCDLNTPVGYLKVVEQVRMLPNPPIRDRGRYPAPFPGR
jgi:putative DNA primase/helicase